MELLVSIAEQKRTTMELDEWVRQKVERLGLDADVYVEYGTGILADEDADVAERVQSVVSMFSSAADGLVSEAEVSATLNEQEMIADVERLLASASAKQEEEEQRRRREAEKREQELREKQKKEAELALEKEKEKALARQKMSREELAAREKLISEYGFSVISEYDEDGNVVKVDDKEKAPAGLDNVAQNSNKARVNQAQNAMREKMKKEHEKKVAREKELLEKDKARKDKAKRRTVKREKQRGAG